MKIKQFEKKESGHLHYVILSECEQEIVLVDPADNIGEYVDYAQENHAKIIAIIETHPYREFVEAHLKLHIATGAAIYCSKVAGAKYPHLSFDDNQVISFGKIKLEALNTPGYTADSICIVLDHNGKDFCVFTGETLLVGDCARPDAGRTRGGPGGLDVQMYHALRKKLLILGSDVVVYPANNQKDFFGIASAERNRSTMGEEKKNNWSLQGMSEKQFITLVNTVQQVQVI